MVRGRSDIAVNPKTRLWSREDLEQLERLYTSYEPYYTVEEISKILDRTINATRLKASRLKLKRPWI